MFRGHNSTWSGPDYRHRRINAATQVFASTSENREKMLVRDEKRASNCVIERSEPGQCGRFGLRIATSVPSIIRFQRNETLMTLTKKIFRQLLACATLLTAATCINAGTVTFPEQTVPLSDLLGGSTISVGDKLFGAFTYNQTGDMPTAENVDVIPIITDGDYGLRFQGGFIDMVGGSASDSLITFTVSAPGPWITGANLAANLEAPGGVALVAETFLPEFPTTSMSVTSGINLVASTDFDAPVQVLNVQKDILLLGQSSPATLSFVDQTFPQVPEPATGFLFLAGLVGMLKFRRCR